MTESWGIRTEPESDLRRLLGGLGFTAVVCVVLSAVFEVVVYFTLMAVALGAAASNNRENQTALHRAWVVSATWGPVVISLVVIVIFMVILVFDRLIDRR